MATAWRASPVSSTRLAPTRSATSPQMILPLSEARPAALSTVAAAIAGTPWSIAWVTMWKIGPECAAQHAKYVNAIAANCGVRSACAAVSSPSALAVAAGRPSVAPAGGARADPVGERAPEERSDAHAVEVEERGRGDARARPAHRLRHGLEEDPEREHRPEPDAGHDHGGAHDDPAVEELHRLGSPHGFAAFLWRFSRSACSRAASSGGKISGGKSDASTTWRISITSPSANGQREAHSIASSFDFTRISQKPAISSLGSAKGPDVSVGLPPENAMRAPFELAWSPSPASNTPAFTMSSLNLPIAAISSLLGRTPASEFLLALTCIMNRIVISLLGFRFGAGPPA